jgi:hypothetical protein
MSAWISQRQFEELMFGHHSGRLQCKLCLSRARCSNLCSAVTVHDATTRISPNRGPKLDNRLSVQIMFSKPKPSRNTCWVYESAEPEFALRGQIAVHFPQPVSGSVSCQFGVDHLSFVIRRTSRYHSIRRLQVSHTKLICAVFATLFHQ